MENYVENYILTENGFIFSHLSKEEAPDIDKLIEDKEKLLLEVYEELQKLKNNK